MEQYGQFVESFVANPTFDPWSPWLESGGQPDAFPYGWPLLLLMSGAYYFGSYLNSGIFFITLLYVVLDLITLVAISRWDGRRPTGPSNSAKFFYSLAPIPLLAIGFSGANDFFPMMLVFLAAFLMGREKFAAAGILLGLAIGSKVLLIIALAAAMMFVIRTPSSRLRNVKMLLGAFVTSSVSLFPIAYSPGLRNAITSSSETIILLTWGLETPGGTLLLAPVFASVSLLLIWQVKRMNRDLLNLTIATPLIALAILPGAPLGWSLWALPFLSLLLATLPLRIVAIGYAAVSLRSLSALGDFEVITLSPESQDLFTAATMSASFLTYLILTLFLWREYAVRSDFVRLQKRPALVLIAGDSGVGKDTLAEGIIRTLGPSTCVHVSGDDYHSWDRGHGSWDHLTHLNPAANDLDHYFNSLISLASGKPVSHGHYDHAIGRRRTSQKTEVREFVISSGLHALWSSDLNSLASLRVFLSMSDELRLSLKIERDVRVRGHSESSVVESEQRRRGDFRSFIMPQEKYADVSIHSSLIDTSIDYRTVPVTEITSPVKIFDGQLLSELTHTCGLETDFSSNPDGSRTIKVIGEAHPKMLSFAFSRIEPEITGVLGPGEEWSSGGPGVVQFVCLVYLANSLRRERLIS